MHVEIESLRRDASDLKIIKDLKKELDEKNYYFINFLQVKRFEIDKLKNLVEKLQLEISENKLANKPAKTWNSWM
jgi:hypothetical protein